MGMLNFPTHELLLTRGTHLNFGVWSFYWDFITKAWSAYVADLGSQTADPPEVQLIQSDPRPHHKLHH